MMTRREQVGRYTPLLAMLREQQADAVTLTFAAIEALIGRPLSVSARVSQSMWAGGSKRLQRDLQAIGWRAHLDVRRHVVEFRRVPAERYEG
jgi:hypothetical protein